MNKSIHLFLALVLFGCQSGEDEKKAPDLGDHQGGGEECGGEQPVVESVTCENTGLQYNSDEGRDIPTITFYTHVTDLDRDLHAYRQRIQFDDVLDNSLSSESETLEVTGTTDDDDCQTGDVDLSLTLYLKGGPPEYGETYEFYVTVTDASDISSEAFLQQCTMPNIDGSDA